MQSHSLHFLFNFSLLFFHTKNVAELSQQLSHLFMNSEYSDVNFIVDSVKFPANRSILAVRSSYFRGMLYGGLAETNQRDIELKVPLEAFKSLLKYMYTGVMPLNNMKMDDILDSLGLAEQYALEALKLAISSYLNQNVSQEKCFEILDAARLYNLNTLIDVCLTFMDRNATELITSNRLKTLSQDSLCTLLERDSFFAPEVDIFRAVNEWYKNNPNADIQVL